jgi:hypothetical protein
MHELARRVALLVSLCLLAMSVAPACADSVTFSQDTTPIVSADWADLGAGPALIQNHSTKGVYIAAAATKPAAGAIGHRLAAEMGARAFETPLHLWARAAVDASPATSPVLEVTSTAGGVSGSVLVSGAQKITTTATIASGQTTSGAIDLGTARIWAIITPSALAATSVTFLASHDCAAYSPLYDSSGSAVSWTVAAARYVINADPAKWLSVRCFKLTIGAGEAADRNFVVEAVP